MTSDSEPTRKPPPVMALRTYTSLRLGSVAVIALLAIAIVWEIFYGTIDNCLQGSISAYYYTPVQSVFVGTLLTLGLVMIVLWGRRPFEDAFFNLAGMLAPVVAFVPTNDTNRCGITDASGAQVDSTAEKNDVLEANRDAIVNNMTAYFFVVAAVLVIVLVVGILAQVLRWPSIVEHPVAYWFPWGLALALWIFGANKFWGDREWIYSEAHEWAATIMFVFIGLVVIHIGYHKWRAERLREGSTESQHSGRRRKPGATAYFAIAALMVVGVVVFRLAPDVLPAQLQDNRTFWLEAWEIALLAVFWSLQTWDRWDEGAPPRTRAEADRMRQPS